MPERLHWNTVDMFLQSGLQKLMNEPLLVIVSLLTLIFLPTLIMVL